MRDRLADLHADALDLGETLPHVGHEFRPGAVLEHERRFDLRGVHPQSVFVQLGTAGLAGDGLDFRNGKQDFLHRTAYPVALRQRDPRLGGDVDGQRAFVEPGQKTAPHPQEEHHPGHEQHAHRSEHPALVSHHPLQGTTVMLLEPGRYGRFLLGAAQGLFAGEQDRAQHRGERYRYDHRGKQRDDKRNTQRTEHPSLHPREEKQGQERYDGNDGRVHHRAADLHRGVEHHGQHPAPLLGWQRMVFPKPFIHVFHVDDRIVHQRTDGNGHTAQAHRIDGQPHCLEYQHRRKQREGKRNEGNDRRTGTHQEQEQHDDHEQPAFQQGFLYVVDRVFDKIRLTEYVGRYVNPSGQLGREFRESGIEFFGQFDRSGGRLLGHGDQHRRMAFFRSQAQQGGLSAGLHPGHIAQGNGLPVHRFDHRTGHLLGTVGSGDPADDVFVAPLVEHATGCILVEAFRSAGDLIERYPVVLHPGGVHQDLVLLDVAPDDRCLGYSRGGEQAGTDGPVGQGAQFLQRNAVRGERNDEHLAQDGRLRSERRASHRFGQGIGYGREFFGDDLPCLVNIGSPVEFHPQHRKSGSGRTADATHVGGSVQGRLQGKGNDLFHLLGGQSRRFGEHGNRRGVQIGKYIDFHLPGHQRTGHPQRHRSQNDHDAVVDTVTDDLVQHLSFGILQRPPVISVRGREGSHRKPKPPSRGMPRARQRPPLRASRKGSRRASHRAARR